MRDHRASLLAYTTIMAPYGSTVLKTYLNMERRNSSTHTNMVRFSAAPCGVYIIVYFFLCLMSALGYVARPLQGSGLADRRTMVLMRRMMPRLSERNTVAAAPARIDLLLRLLLAAGPFFRALHGNMACHFNFQRRLSTQPSTRSVGTGLRVGSVGAPRLESVDLQQ